MAKHVLLNNVEHKNLKVITARGAEYGDKVMSTLTFPTEFRFLQAHYPIVFRKTSDGAGFEPLVLFGIEDGENLFLNGDRWDAAYVPLLIQRQPFLIGVNGEELMVNIDMDSPRVSETQGVDLFLPQGGTTDYLEQVNAMLGEIHQGLRSTPPFIAALQEHDLLESFVLDIELDSGSKHRMVGFYTINEDKLAALDAATAGRLHEAGHLQAVYMVLASLSNFRALIERKNTRGQA